MARRDGVHPILIAQQTCSSGPNEISEPGMSGIAGRILFGKIE